MAVYEGARPRSTFLPRRRLEAPLLRPQAPALPRRRSRVAMRANRRPRTVGFIIGAIVIGFLLSFFSLVQTVRVSTSGYDMYLLNPGLPAAPEPAAAGHLRHQPGGSGIRHPPPGHRRRPFPAARAGSPPGSLGSRTDARPDRLSGPPLLDPAGRDRGLDRHDGAPGVLADIRAEEPDSGSRAGHRLHRDHTRPAGHDLRPDRDDRAGRDHRHVPRDRGPARPHRCPEDQHHRRPDRLSRPQRRGRGQGPGRHGHEFLLHPCWRPTSARTCTTRWSRTRPWAACQASRSRSSRCASIPRPAGRRTRRWPPSCSAS